MANADRLPPKLRQPRGCLSARVCERCWHPFVVAARFRDVTCGPCRLAMRAQDASAITKSRQQVFSSKIGQRVPIGGVRVHGPKDEEE